MRSHLLSVPLLLSILLCDVAASAADNTISKTAPPTSSASPSSSSSSGQANDFNFAMYGALKNKDGNLFFSAPSLREALGIAYLGAHGSTATEMASAMRLRPNSDADAKTEINDFQSAKGTATLSIANRLWADQRFTMLPGFTKSATDAYGSSAQRVDFLHQPEGGRLTINGWVASQTNNKILNLLPPGSVKEDARLIITNAIYFKGDWANAFAKDGTHDEAFLVDGKTSLNVPMMHEHAWLNATEKDGVKVLEMPYAKSDLEMDVVLPDGATGLANVEEKLTTGQFGTWISSATQRSVDVSFPKVTFTWGGSVKEQLKSLGMRTAFDQDHADFTGIAAPSATDAPLYVSDVVHKAFIGIDEKGTEAAAATGVIVATATAVMAPPPPMVFKADHPFVFVIRDVKHNRILFMGRVTNPKA